MIGNGESVIATVNGAKVSARVLRAVTAQREGDPPGTPYVCTYRIEITEGPYSGHEMHVLPHHVRRAKKAK